MVQLLGLIGWVLGLPGGGSLRFGPGAQSYKDQGTRRLHCNLGGVPPSSRRNLGPPQHRRRNLGGSPPTSLPWFSLFDEKAWAPNSNLASLVICVVSLTNLHFVT